MDIKAIPPSQVDADLTESTESDEPNHLIDDLIEHNAKFREMIEKSKASGRKPFSFDHDA